MEKKTWINKASISWSAVFIGAIAGLGINFLLNLLSLSIGLSMFVYADSGKAVLSYSGFIGFLLVGIISMFTAGWLAGRLTSAKNKKIWGILYGFIAWCLSLIITTVLLTNMIQFAAFHSNFTSQPDLIAVKIANDKPIQTETKNNKSLPFIIIADLEKKSKVITLNSIFTFLLFFFGALSSCAGGYLGYARKIKITSSKHN